MQKIKSAKNFILYTCIYFVGIYALIFTLNEITALIGKAINAKQLTMSIYYYIDLYGIICAFLVSFAFLWPDIARKKRIKFMATYTAIFMIYYFFDFYLRYS